MARRHLLFVLPLLVANAPPVALQLLRDVRFAPLQQFVVLQEQLRQ